MTHPSTCRSAIQAPFSGKLEHCLVLFWALVASSSQISASKTTKMMPLTLTQRSYPLDQHPLCKQVITSNYLVAEVSRTEMLIGVYLTQQLNPSYYNLRSFPVPNAGWNRWRKSEAFRSASAQATQQPPSPARKPSGRQADKWRAHLLWKIGGCSATWSCSQKPGNVSPPLSGSGWCQAIFETSSSFQRCQYYAAGR